MKLVNNSNCALSHGEYRLEIGKVIDVPENVAKIWLKYKGISIHVSPEDVEKAKEQAVKEAIEAFKKENAKVENDEIVEEKPKTAKPRTRKPKKHS